MLSVGQEMEVRIAVQNLTKPLAELSFKETHDFPHPLQGEAFPPKLANDGNLGQLMHRVNSPVPFARRLDDAALVPPLQLAGRDAGKRDDLVRCEAILHCSSETFKTLRVQNVSNILGATWRESRKQAVEKG